MKVKKTHVKSAKRQKRENEAAAVAAAAARRSSKKSIKPIKPKTIVNKRFTFKSQQERYKDISVNLQSLLDDAVERYGRYSIQEVESQSKDDNEHSSDEEDIDDEEHADMLMTPMSSALSEYALLNTSISFQNLHRALYPLTRSLPLIIHHRVRIASLLVQALTQPNLRDAALCAAHTVDLIPALVQSLSPDPDFQLLDLDAILGPILRALVKTAVDPPASHSGSTGDRGNDPTSAVEISKRAFQALAWIFREIGGDLGNRGNAQERNHFVWQCLLPTLKGEKPLVDLDWNRATATLDLPHFDEKDIDASGDEAIGIQTVDEPEHTDSMLNPEDSGDADTDVASDERDAFEDDAKIRGAVPTAKTHTKPHFRQLLATCYAFMMRKIKPGVALDSVVCTMLQSLRAASPAAKEILADSLAWVLAESVKSVDTHIHSRGAAIFRSFFLQAIAVGEAIGSTLLEAALTAIVHHSRLEHITDISSILIDALQEVGTEPAVPALRFTTTSRLVGILVATRQGSRLSDKRRLDILGDCETILNNLARHFYADQDANLVREIVELATKALLVVPDLQGMLSQGRQVVSALWGLHGEYPEVTAASFATLAERQWPFFHGFVEASLPCDASVLQHRTHLAFTAQIAALGQLGEASRKLQGPLSAELPQRLQSWLVCRRNGKLTLRQTTEILNMLDLVTEQPSESLVAALVSFVKALASDQLEEDLLRQEFGDTPANSGLLAAMCLQKLSSVSTKEQPLDIESLLSLLQKYHWHRAVVLALAEVIASAQIQPNLADFLSAVQSWLSSEDAELRIAALAILRACLPRSGIIAKLQEVEAVPLTAQASREKTMHLRRAGILLKNIGTDDVELILGIRYILAMFKVNFKPLWDEATAVIAGLLEASDTERCKAIWEHVHSQLTTAAMIPTALLGLTPLWASDTSIFDSNLVRSEHTLHYAQFRCTSHDRIAAGFEARLRAYTTHSGIRPVHRSLQISQQRLDVANYEAQLLSLCKYVHTLVESRSRAFISLFFAVIKNESLQDVSPVVLPVTVKRERLAAWLDVFTAFKNPKALYRSAEVYAFLLDMLSNGDAKLQKLALEGILTWKSGQVRPYEESLRKLLEPSAFRDTLLQLSLAPTDDSIQAAHRSDFLSILMRLLYGLTISKGGGGGAKHLQDAKRSAVLRTLSACSPSELDVFVDLMLAPFTDVALRSQGTAFSFTDHAPKATFGQQNGFLTLFGDVLTYMGKNVKHRWADFLAVLLNLAHHAANDNEEKEESMKAQKQVRQSAYRRLSQLFLTDPYYDFEPYLEPIFASLIRPRLEHFAMQNSQAPSALLLLFEAWTKEPSLHRILVEYDPSLLPSVFACLAEGTVKDSVVGIVLDMSQRLASSDPDSGTGSISIPALYSEDLLRNLGVLLGRRASKVKGRDQISMRIISILGTLAPKLAEPDLAIRLTTVILPLLRKPPYLVPEAIKVDLLRTVKRGMELVIAEKPSDASGPTLMKQVLDTVSSLMSSLQTSSARTASVAAYGATISEVDESVSYARFIADINSYSAKRLDTPDFDRRLAAFARFNDKEYRNASPLAWTAIVHNMFYFLQDPEELSIRSNANSALQHFVRIAGPSMDGDMRNVLVNTFLPHLRAGLRSKQELVRMEVVAVLEAAVEASVGIAEVEEMKTLLVGGDIEANFFTNIHHVQLHRRTRALRRLAEEAAKGTFSSKTMAEYFVPLISHNLLSAPGDKGADLVNESVQCLGKLAYNMSWPTYNRLLQQYLRLAADTREGQKIFVRTAVSILKGFHVSFENGGDAASMAILKYVEDRLLPRLMQFLEKRGETDEAIRLPMAEGIAAVIQHVPKAEKAADVAALITALAQILRSKMQDVRDLTRATLVNVASLFGSDYLAVTVKELRGALLRGPQLHVLAYTVHTLLVRLSTQSPVDVREALPDLLHVIFDDLFGTPSKERDSAEFRSKTKVKEVRQSKSLDSAEIIAKSVSSSDIHRLLAPLRKIISETESIKTMQRVEDVFRVIVNGLLNNPSLDNEALLSLCYAVISNNTDFLKIRKRKKSSEKQIAADFEVQVKRARAAQQDLFSLNAHRFVSFGLDLLNGAFRRNRFDLHNPESVSRLDPFVALIGNTLFTDESHVLERALRATATLARCPLVSVDTSAPVLVKQIMSILDSIGGTSSDLAQTAVRTLASLIRDKKSVQLNSPQIDQLLSLVEPDIEEPDQQAALFSLLRALVSRTCMSDRIYDLMDRVAEILIANQSSNVREICRSIYLQFLLDYPQGKARLRTSLEYLAKNMSGYVHESGRSSALELVNAILGKFSSDLIDQYANLFFISLTLVISNDSSAKCREMASENVKLVWSRCSRDVQGDLMKLTVSWGAFTSGEELQKISAQIMGISLECTKDPAETAALVERFIPVLSGLVKQPKPNADVDTSESADLAWQVQYQALLSLAKILRLHSSAFKPYDAELWRTVRDLLLFPHMWVRSAALKLLGLLFASLPSIVPDVDLLDAASKFILQLRSRLLEDSLAVQIVKNLVFVGKRFSALSIAQQGSDRDDRLRKVHTREDDASESEEEARDPLSDPFHWLFVKLSHRARVAHQTRPSMYSEEGRSFQWSKEPATILRFFGAMLAESSAIRSELLGRQTLQILIPIVRITDDPNGGKDPQLDDLQTLAKEVQELLAARVGNTIVAETYSSIRRKISSRREERKQAAAVAALANPEADAKRKAKRTESKAKAKKRKNNAFSETKARYGQKGPKRSRVAE